MINRIITYGAGRGNASLKDRARGDETSSRRETEEATDVGALLYSVLELHKPKFDRHHVSASTRNDDHATAVIYLEQMRQVFSNLLLRAIDVMPKGGKVFATITGPS